MDFNVNVTLSAAPDLLDSIKSFADAFVAVRSFELIKPETIDAQETIPVQGTPLEKPARARKPTVQQEQTNQVEPASTAVEATRARVPDVEELRKLTVDLVRGGKREESKDLLAEYNVGSITELCNTAAPAEIVAFYDRLKELTLYLGWPYRA